MKVGGGEGVGHFALACYSFLETFVVQEFFLPCMNGFFWVHFPCAGFIFNYICLS